MDRKPQKLLFDGTLLENFEPQLWELTIMYLFAKTNRIPEKLFTSFPTGLMKKFDFSKTTIQCHNKANLRQNIFCKHCSGFANLSIPCKGSMCNYCYVCIDKRNQIKCRECLTYIEKQKQLYVIRSPKTSAIPLGYALPAHHRTCTLCTFAPPFNSCHICKALNNDIFHTLFCPKNLNSRYYPEAMEKECRCEPRILSVGLHRTNESIQQFLICQICINNSKETAFDSSMTLILGKK